MNLALAYAEPPYRCGMPKRPRDTTPRAQMLAMGKAIRELRLIAGPLGDKITTKEAGERMGATRQTWENYENAKGPVILRQDVQEQVAVALGVTREDLLLQYRRALGEDVTDPAPHHGVEEAPSRAWPAATSAQTRQVTMPDDTLRPWASSGMTIVYDRHMWPAPEVGVVLEDEATGDRQVKIFGHSDAEAHHCFELFPERKPVSYPRAQYKAYRVIARLG